MTREQVTALADAFANVLRQWLTPQQFAEMKALNESVEFAGDQICAGHNYCDANKGMLEALTELDMAAKFNPADEEHCRLWRDAWALARKRHLGQMPNTVGGLMTCEQMVQAAIPKRTAAVLRCEWFIQEENRTFTAFAEDEAQKQAWLVSTEAKGWKVVQ